MNKKIITIISSIILLATLITYIVYDLKPGMEFEKVSIDQPSAVSEVEIDNNSFETYESKMGFSFQYPAQFFVMEDPEAGIPERLFVLIKKELDEDPSGIIISTAENKDNQTALEWLEGPYSGADLSKEHGTLDLGGQEAIFLEGGTWIVAVTPDNKYRISLATLASPNLKNGDFLFLGMDTILSSFKFSR